MSLNGGTCYYCEAHTNKCKQSLPATESSVNFSIASTTRASSFPRTYCPLMPASILSPGQGIRANRILLVHWRDSGNQTHGWYARSAVVDKRFVDKIGDKTASLRKYNMSTKILFCQNNVPFWKRKDTFKKQNIDKISLQKGLTVCEKRVVKRVQRHAWHSVRHCLPGQSPMIHRVTRRLDFGRNITAFISWPLFCRQLLPSGWNLTWRVDKDNLSSTTAFYASAYEWLCPMRPLKTSLTSQ